jgi:hypothetical protein
VLCKLTFEGQTTSTAASVCIPESFVSHCTLILGHASPLIHKSVIFQMMRTAHYRISASVMVESLHCKEKAGTSNTFCRILFSLSAGNEDTADLDRSDEI